ncbi:MAG TPA: hypothetical protein VH986_08595 [Acidimicrobiia bacterium]
MAVMVTLTLRTDAQTYQELHEQLVAVAVPAGMLFHAAYERDGNERVVDSWPSAESFQAFLQGPAGEGMQASGIPAPDDVEITPVLNADGR